MNKVSHILRKEDFMKRVLLVMVMALAVVSSSFAMEKPQQDKTKSFGFFTGLFGSKLNPEEIHNRKLWMGKIRDIIGTLKNAWIAPMGRARRKTARLAREVRTYGLHNPFNRQLSRRLNFLSQSMHSEYMGKREAIHRLRNIRRFIAESL